MYGMAKKKKPRWVNLNEHDKEKKRDSETASEYDDDSSRSETVPPPEQASKVLTAINDVKTLLSSTDKMDNLLEYIKSIDSDTKNTLELVNKMDKTNTSSSVAQEESFTND